ncbi:MAG TPA: biotin/lipoyl-containing protein, partial [Dermatophilaceae bacterium]|nr:biotin/lipoyl-containing protein [Dermatophilaceae bacterium]
AGTCEFLVGQDGSISFLEVNTRLQVEHPVTEEVTGIDLVREQLRIADGEALGYDDPPIRGHSIEFRINGEDPGRGFLPAPGHVARFDPPSGPGIRLDSGVRAGDAVGGAFDSLLAKLVVTGRDRRQALERARRALAEFEIDGLATVLPFARAVVEDPAFAPADGAAAFTVHTRWIETEMTTTFPPYAAEPADTPEQTERRSVVVEVAGKRLEVVLPAALLAAPAAGRAAAPKRRAAVSRPSGPAAGGDAITAPMQGTIVKVAVEEGQQVAADDLLVVLEAMKMEQPITAPHAGTVTGLAAQVGQTMSNGEVIARIVG